MPPKSPGRGVSTTTNTSIPSTSCAVISWHLQAHVYQKLYEWMIGNRSTSPTNVSRTHKNINTGDGFGHVSVRRILFSSMTNMYIWVVSGYPSPRHGYSSGCGRRNDLQIWSAAANILNMQKWTADKGRTSSFGVGRELAGSRCKKYRNIRLPSGSITRNATSDGFVTEIGDDEDRGYEDIVWINLAQKRVVHLRVTWQS
jgi:hypothetical protein